MVIPLIAFSERLLCRSQLLHVTDAHFQLRVRETDSVEIQLGAGFDSATLTTLKEDLFEPQTTLQSCDKVFVRALTLKTATVAQTTVKCLNLAGTLCLESPSTSIRVAHCVIHHLQVNNARQAALDNLLSSQVTIRRCGSATITNVNVVKFAGGTTLLAYVCSLCDSDGSAYVR